MKAFKTIGRSLILTWLTTERWGTGKGKPHPISDGRKLRARLAWPIQASTKLWRRSAKLWVILA
jgi:hypothetical protein